MRTIHQIFLVGILLILLFIVKDDLRSAYNHFLVYLNDKVSVPAIIPNTTEGSGVRNGVMGTSSQASKNVSKVVNTPGALQVVKNIVSNQTAGKLSKDNIIKETNIARAENGNLPALKENSKLDLSAEKKLQDMFAKQYFEHVSPTGVKIDDLIKEVGYEYILIGENLALGDFNNDKALLDAWMTSAGHRENILNNKYIEIGVAVARGSYQGRNVWMAVQHFGLPKSVCPSVSDVLLGTININENEITKMTSNLSILKTEISNGGVYKGMTTSELIVKYNDLVNLYNKLISDTKNKIDNYNQQVRNFNSCLTSNS